MSCLTTGPVSQKRIHGIKCEIYLMTSVIKTYIVNMPDKLARGKGLFLYPR